MLPTFFKLAAASTSVDVGNGQVKVNGGYNGSLFDLFGTVSKLLIFVVGAVAVIMIIVGGLNFVLSAGNPAKTKTARETILYAVIGLIVAVGAYAIVGFVLTRLKG